MRIIAIGDIHMDTSVLERITGLSEAELVIITGDLTNFGGRKEAKEILDTVKAVNPRVYAQLGNLDQPEVNDYLEELGINLHGHGFTHDNVGFFGVGGSNTTPFNTPTEFSEDELSAFARKGFEEVISAPLKVLVSHTPPLNTTTDRIGGGIHVGSSAIRKFIEVQQPDFCFTGHIHEARAIDTIGSTLILNPGMLKDSGWIEFTRDESGSWEARLN